ncbi:hypothetical protein GSI_13388 [Ganoderma sinense ZZ0214-1]|uniref:Uncharacterized protein n=1 Tax=Ganoderma sinense ZZ0214-1 TaxID=1077348 RepID=A0A2G8RVZ1_9APHY|nr:hypothetical protein GSI_13388 [Ganoderma sinense ZZ0214-1]
MHLKLLSLSLNANPGAPAASSEKDSYAAQFFYGTPGGEDAFRAANAQYAALVPTTREGWRGAMTLPERLFFMNTSQDPADWNLITLPVDLSPVFDPSPSASMPKTWTGNAAVEIDLNTISSGAFYLETCTTCLPDFSGAPVDGTDFGGAVTFTLSSQTSGESLSGGFLFALR